MAWLRIDDGFAAHPKVTALNHRDRWTWIAVLCYCARYDTDGWLPENISEHVSGAKNGFVSRCKSLGLLDENDGELRVHDWQHYGPKDPTKAARQAKWRKSKRQNVDDPVDAVVDGDVDEVASTETSTSRAGAGARSRPVPSTTPKPEEQNPPTPTVEVDDARDPQAHPDFTGLSRLGDEPARILAAAARRNLEDTPL